MMALNVRVRADGVYSSGGLRLPAASGAIQVSSHQATNPSVQSFRSSTHHRTQAQAQARPVPKQQHGDGSKEGNFRRRCQAQFHVLGASSTTTFLRACLPPQILHHRHHRHGSVGNLDVSKAERCQLQPRLPCAGAVAAEATTTAASKSFKGRRPPKTSRTSQRIKCSAAESARPGDPDHSERDFAAQMQPQKKQSLVETLLTALKGANASLPYAIVASAVLAFFYPPSFLWFTPRYYAPALGFLMFAVGINLSPQAFLKAMERPAVIAVGYGGQFLVKPVLGLLVAYIAVSLLHLPSAIGTGLLLVSCVSGAQLSNYATFMVDPSMAPLSIVMTALSTITAVVVTPALSLLLLGRMLPINVAGMMASITQIVVVPIAAGLSLNKFLPSVSNLLRPFLPLSSVLVTCCCIGSPMAVNIEALRSQFGLMILLPVIIFHSLAFIAGYQSAKAWFSSEADVEGLARTISFETGMQSSLLALALANSFFEDPIVCLPPAISTVLMSLMGFGLTLVWQKQRRMAL